MEDFDFSEHAAMIIMHDGVKVAEITQEDITLFNNAVIVTVDTLKS